MTVEYLLNGWMVSEERDVKSFVLSVVFLIERKRKYGDPRIWSVDALICVQEVRSCIALVARSRGLVISNQYC